MNHAAITSKSSTWPQKIGILIAALGVVSGVRRCRVPFIVGTFVFAATVEEKYPAS